MFRSHNDIMRELQVDVVYTNCFTFFINLETLFERDTKRTILLENRCGKGIKWNRVKNRTTRTNTNINYTRIT